MCPRTLTGQQGLAQVHWSGGQLSERWMGAQCEVRGARSRLLPFPLWCAVDSCTGPIQGLASLWPPRVAATILCASVVSRQKALPTSRWTQRTACALPTVQMSPSGLLWAAADDRGRKTGWYLAPGWRGQCPAPVFRVRGSPRSPQVRRQAQARWHRVSPAKARVPPVYHLGKLSPGPD